MLFFRGPDSGRADMFMTDDADHFPFRPDRDVQHGGDSKGNEIAAGKFGCLGIGLGLVGDDDIFRGQFREISGKGCGWQLGSAGMRFGYLFVQIRATNGRMTVSEEPDAGSGHSQAVRRHSCNDMKGVGELSVIEVCIRRQFEESCLHPAEECGALRSLFFRSLLGRDIPENQNGAVHHARG